MNVDDPVRESLNNRFCWNSASAGWAMINGNNYLTLGVSLEVSVLAFLFLLW